MYRSMMSTDFMKHVRQPIVLLWQLLRSALRTDSAYPFFLTSFSSPIVTGTSVVAIRYKDGVVMAADTLGLASEPLAISNQF